MERMNTRNALIETLKDLRIVEIKARDDYLNDTFIYNDNKLIKNIKKIKLDEDKHIIIIEKLIKMLEKNQ
jgi:hypothetical protein